MSTELATTNNVSAALNPSLVSQIILSGDIGALDDEQRVMYYKAVCERLGLDWTTKPFQIIHFEKQNKTSLYATKDCAAQLTALYNPSVAIVSRERVGDLYVATAEVTKRDGSKVQDIGAVNYGTYPDQQANAIKKAVTQAKRRAILSAFGLGALDETEIEDIKDAKVVEIVVDTPPVDTVVLDIIASLESATNVDELQAITDRVKKLTPSQKDDIRQHTQDAAVRIGCKWIGGKWIMPEVVA